MSIVLGSRLVGLAPYASLADGLTFETACDQAKRFHGLVLNIPDEFQARIHTLTDVRNWVEEIVVYFEYEGIDRDADVGDMGSLVYPSVVFENYRDGLYTNHVLGTTKMLSGDVALSARFANPISPWYYDDASVLTLIHELAHAQGVMFPGVNFDEESSAQMIALEVAAAMVNKGNKLVLYSFLGELTALFSSAARWLAMQEGRDEDWYDFRANVFTDPFAAAALDKSDRFWASDPKHLAYILETYNFLPAQAIWEAIHGTKEIEGVRLPINWVLDSARAARDAGMVIYTGPPTTPTASPVPIPDGLPLVVDDLAYLFDHVEAMVGELNDA